MRLLCLILLLVLMCSWAYCTVLAQKGMAKAVIVCGRDATEPERNAAEELAKYLKLVSGADFLITEVPSDKAANIYVGQTEAVKTLMGDFNWDSLKRDGILIKSMKNTLVLAGDRPRGTLYAVYTFLEDQLGIRFWTPYAEKIPETETITVKDGLSHTYTPPFFSREAFFNLNVGHPDFAVKQKSNGRHNEITEAWGGHIDLIGWAHTFGVFISPNIYFDEHPEWFSMINGKREGGNTQLCLSNDECVEELGNRVLERLRQEDNPSIISVTQNDNAAYCQCEKCTALAEKYGSQSGLILHAVNKVADRVKEEFPDVLVETFAYWYTVEAPKNIKPRENVIIRLCNIQNNFGTPLYECLERPGDESQQVNASFYKNLDEWSRLTDNLFIWNYIVNFTNYYIIHPNFHCLKPDLQCFRRHKAVAVFEQGDSFNETPCFNALKGYLTARLLWNPDIDDDACMKEFLGGYYGAAGPYLYDVIVRCEAEVKKADVNLRCYMANLNWLPCDAFIYCFEKFNAAIAAVSGDKALTDRVTNELLSFQWAWYLLSEEDRELIKEAGCLLWDDEERYERFFYKWAYDHNNTYGREGGKFQHQAPIEEKPLKKTANRPEGVSEDSAWFEIVGDDFQLIYPDRCTVLYDDPAASVGKGAGLKFNSTEWAVQRRIGKPLREALKNGYKKAEIYITARREGKCTASQDRPAYTVLLYDETNGSMPFTNSVAVKDLKDTYTTVKLGELELRKYGSIYLALAATSDSALGEAVVTDRVYFVLSK